MNDYTELDKFIESLGIEYATEFVPFSKSRNAVDNPKLSDLSLNWAVTLKRGYMKLSTDYMQGIGHLPNDVYKSRYARIISVFEWEAILNAYEKGVGAIPPLLRDVLWSLILDSDAIEYMFEDWADSYGYDKDSRQAEKIYNSCLEIGLQLRRLIGDENISKLRELYQDY